MVVSTTSAELETPEKLGPKTRISGMGVHSALRRFKANEAAQLIISGDGDTCLGVYVFDAHGNCVAKDDMTSPESSDDLTARWIPHEAAGFIVEVRNGGISPNGFEFLLR
jgi:hypothetical protein